MGRSEQAPGSDLDRLVDFEQVRDLMETPPGQEPGTDPGLSDLISEATADRFGATIDAPTNPEEKAAEDEAIAALDLDPAEE